MPFSKTRGEHTEEYWTTWWRFLKRKIEEVPNCVARRSRALRGDIVREIIRDLYLADIVIADLTDENPNVYWELGVRQTLKPGTITIAETRKHIASDMGMKGILRYYPKDTIKNEEFVQSLKDAINDYIENPESPDSHVLETLSGRGSLYQIINKEVIKRKTHALYDEFIFNISTIEKIYDIMYRNKKYVELGKRENISHIAYLPYCTCIQHLLTTRYLDLSSSEYEILSNYLMWINAFGLQIPKWTLSNDIISNWIEQNEEMFVENFHNWNEIIIKIQQKYSS